MDAVQHGCSEYCTTIVYEWKAVLLFVTDPPELDYNPSQKQLTSLPVSGKKRQMVK